MMLELMLKAYEKAHEADPAAITFFHILDNFEAYQVHALKVSEILSMDVHTVKDPENTLYMIKISENEFPVKLKQIIAQNLPIHISETKVNGKFGLLPENYDDE